MKTTGRMDGGGKVNNLIDTEDIYNAYTLYFEKYLQGYAAHGIISRLCPQNEMDASPGYPGCVIPPAQMVKLVANHLAPAFRRDGIDDLARTFREKPAAPWAAECLGDATFREAVAGLGIQDIRPVSQSRRWPDRLSPAFASCTPRPVSCCGGKNTAW